MSRRTPGEGSIFKLSDGRWAADIPAGKGPFGRRKRVRVSAKTAAAVREKMLAKRREIAAGGTVKDPAVATWIVQTWLPVVRARRRASTAYDYERTVVRFLVPKLGTVRFSALEPADLDAWYIDLRKKGASASAVAKVHTVLRASLRYAVRTGVTNRNVAAMIEPPAYRPKERTRYSVDQVRTLLRAAQGHRGEALFIAALFLQMRSGELLALRWADVDLEARTLRVERTMTDDAKGRPVIGETTKTPAGRRMMVVPVVVIAALRAHRERLRAKGNLGELVFPNTKGKPLDSSGVLMRWLHPLQEKAGLPPITFHDLRHTGASILRELGGDLIAIRDRLGHESVETTGDTYVHLDMSAQHALADTLDAVFFASPVAREDAQADGLADARTADHAVRSENGVATAFFERETVAARG